jgi:hypothetical protein
MTQKEENLSLFPEKLGEWLAIQSQALDYRL